MCSSAAAPSLSSLLPLFSRQFCFRLSFHCHSLRRMRAQPLSNTACAGVRVRPSTHAGGKAECRRRAHREAVVEVGLRAKDLPERRALHVRWRELCNHATRQPLRLALQRVHVNARVGREQADGEARGKTRVSRERRGCSENERAMASEIKAKSTNWCTESKPHVRTEGRDGRGRRKE
eukprot:6181206-Pleurochrysis_carterae.AAC.5